MTTWDPSNKSAGITLSAGNLVATDTSSFNQSVIGTVAKSTGKWYLEYSNLIWESGGSGSSAGFADSSYVLGTGPGSHSVMFCTGGRLSVNGSNVITGMTDPTGNGTHRLGFAIDIGGQLIWVRVDGGNWNGNATYNPTTAVGGQALTALGWTWSTLTPVTYLHISTASGGTYNDATTMNCGLSAFTDSIPSGFAAWDTFTLPPRSMPVLVG